MANYFEDPKIENVIDFFNGRRQSRFTTNTPSKFSLGMTILGGILLILGILAYSGVGMYTDWLWFIYDAQQSQVFSRTLATKWCLGLVGFLLSFFVIYFTLLHSIKIVKVYSSIPTNVIEKTGTELLQIIQDKGKWLALGIAGFFGWSFGMSFATRFDQWWMFSSAVDFGKTDSLFGLDIGFYVFRLPWLQFLASNLFFLSLIVLAIVFGTRYLLNSLAQLARAQIYDSFSNRAILLLVGINIIYFSAVQWLARFNFGNIESSQFTGPGYAQSQLLTISTALTFMALGIGLYVLILALIKPSYKIVSTTIPVFIVFWLGASFVVPVVQRFIVEPNKITVEKPYAEKAMMATRFAYQLDSIRIKDFDVQDSPTPQQVAEADSTLQNMRLWDPTVLKKSIDGLQSLQPYYDFAHVDIDRYTINGKQQMVMISPRNIDIMGLPKNTRTWVPSHLQYTHGYGLIMAPVNQALSSGQPVFYIQDMPITTKNELKVEQPRTYFSDYRKNPYLSGSNYSLVNTNVPEFDYPTQNSEQTHQWQGNRGVPVGGWLSRIAHSIQLADGNLLISPNITPKTKLIYRRDIFDRVKRIFPLLELDEDPYIVLLKGKMVWIMDAYLTSDRIPYSSLRTFRNKNINYIRNCAKITVDAYTGEVIAYVVDEKEPMTQAYMKMFPGLLRPSSEATPELKAHYRYGEDLFAIQSDVIKDYHVTRPETFLNNEDIWQVPKALDESSSTKSMPPYYVQMRLPDEKKDSFMLIIPFTPRQKNNMIGWMAAHCDPENYGELVLYRFPKNSQTPGPNQMEAIFNQDASIAQINREFNNDQSEIVPGNLLVIPIGSSILYVKPLFLQTKVSNVQPIPELKKVILALKGKVVIADTYTQALEKLFGGGHHVQSISENLNQIKKENLSSKKLDNHSSILINKVKESLNLFDQAESALRQGNFGLYGELQKKAKEKLSQIDVSP